MCTLFDKNLHFPILIGICGGSGSGKSEFAQNIVTEIEESVLISSDNFYRDLSYMAEEERKDVDFDNPASYDLDELYYTLAKIKKNKLPIVEIPEYNFIDHTRKKEKKKIFIKNIVLVEGLFIFNDKKTRDLFDYKIFIDSASGERLARRLNRDEKVRGRLTQDIIEQWRKFVEPGFQHHIRFTKSFADLVVNSRFEEPIDQPFLQRPLQIIISALKYIVSNKT